MRSFVAALLVAGAAATAQTTGEYLTCAVSQDNQPSDIRSLD